MALYPWVLGRAGGRLAELEAQHDEQGPRSVARSVRRQLRRCRQEAASGVMLYAGTNVLSPMVELSHDSTLTSRPAMGWPGEKVQSATDAIDHLEVIAARQVARAFRARHAEVRFLSATMANLAAMTVCAGPGETIAVLPPEAGGHASYQGGTGTAAIRGLQVVPLPYDPARFDVDLAVLDDFLRYARPRMIVVGGSVALRPHRLSDIRSAAERVGAVLVYDASHPAGLIAAGEFPNPLAEGAHVVTFSTYKTFGGPAGGAAVTNDTALARELATAAYPQLLSNYDPSRLGPLAVAAAEAVAQEPAWAATTIALAQETGARLAALGVPVVGAEFDYSQSHQLMIDLGAHGCATEAVHRLGRHGVFAGPALLPDRRPGIRLGTQEIVRRGAGVDLAADLAGLLHSALADDGPTAGRLLRRVHDRIPVDIWGRPNWQQPRS